MAKQQKQSETILPWTNGELESLLLDLIAHGTETPKADFKSEIELDTPERKAELLKDIIAIATTYDDQNYRDHGFLIYGVKAKRVVGVTKTETDTDKLQNTVEQLLKSYISPMVQVYVVGFETATGQKWGAIVIPPRNNKPFMFFKDFQCQNPKFARKKGEWFVRHGSTTDPGLPEDLAVITQRQTELLLEPLRESIKNLQSRVAKTEDQYNSALFKLVERAVSAIPGNNEPKTEEREQVGADIGEALGMDLSTRLKQKLRTPTDAIAEELVAQAKAIRDYVEGADTGLTWAPQLNNPEENKKTIENLEERMKAFLLSLAVIALNDHKGVYTDSLLRALRILAKAIDAPNGTRYNSIGEALRYYPLGSFLYTIFVCGVAASRGDLLKKVLAVPIKHQGRHETSSITDVFYYWYEAGVLFNDAFAQRWCVPMAHRIRQTLNDHVGEMISEYSEPEYFFRGEFVLALKNIDEGMAKGEDVEHRVPMAGLYLYMHEARGPIEGFLLEHPDWFEKFYDHPVNEILDMFDRNAHKMATSGCIAIGMHGVKTNELYQESLRRRAKK